MIAIHVEMHVPDLQMVKRVGISRAHKAAAAAVLAYLGDERMPLRDRNRMASALHWDRRDPAWRKVKSIIRPGTGNLAHVFTHRTMEKLMRQQERRIFPSRFSLRVRGLNPFYGRRRPGQPPGRQEIERISQEEFAAVAKIYQMAFVEYLNTNPGARFRKRLSSKG